MVGKGYQGRESTKPSLPARGVVRVRWVEETGLARRRKQGEAGVRISNRRE